MSCLVGRIHLRICSFLIAVAIAFTPASASPPTEYIPDAERAKGMALEGRTWRGGDAQFVMQMQQLHDDERQAYLRHVTGLPTDPFAGRPDSAPRFLTFLIEVENLANNALTVHTQQFWLVTNKDQHLFPVDIEELEASYGMMGGQLPEAYRHAGKAVLRGAFNVAPGQSVSGLLIYRGLKDGTRKFHVDPQLTLGSGDVVRLSAPYRRKTDKD